MGVRWLRIGLSLGLVALLTLSLPASEPSRSLETRLTLLLQGESFYFPEWALQAWAEKLLLSVANPQAFLDDETQRRAVRRYLQRLSEAREAAAAWNGRCPRRPRRNRRRSPRSGGSGKRPTGGPRPSVLWPRPSSPNSSA
jgi:hypothetical protein